MIGARLAHYQIIKVIGSGGMGAVYLAEDTRLGRSIALKILPPEAAAQPDRARRFLTEARAASALSHPNVAHIYEAGEADGVSFIAMEFVAGETLKSHAQAPLPVRDVLEVAAQLADALDEAHAAGIVHRDIKGANIVLTPKGLVKVLDFGIAKTPVGLRSGDVTSEATADGAIVGTINYMSPEQALGWEVDGRSDLFSMGIVLYELLAGRLPFQGGTSSETLNRIINDTPPPLRRFNTAVPTELERIVFKALEKDRGRRYQTGRELLVDIRNLQRDWESGGTPKGHARRRTKRRPESIAILPFDADVRADADLEYLADGLTESVIQSLSAVPKLRIMARSTVFRFKGTDLDPQAIGKALRVDAVVSGSVRRLQDRIALRVELAAADDGAHLWGARYQKTPADVFSLQNELAQEIVMGLRVQLSGDDRKRLARKPTVDAQAYQSYLRGRFHLNKRTQEEVETAVRFFDDAIARDGRYALAHAGRAEAYTILGTAGYTTKLSDVTRRARASAERAVEIDGLLAEAHAALGFVRFRFDWDWTAAAAALRRAVELNPGYATAHHWLGMLLTALGRADQALESIDQALASDPLSLIVGSAKGRALHFARRYEEAAAQFHRTLELDPGFTQARYDLGMTYAEMGRLPEAIAEYERKPEVLAGRPVMRAVLANFYARAGETERAAAIVAGFHGRPDAALSLPFELALASVGAGRIDESLSHLETALAVHAGPIVFLKVEPMFDSLRREPRFQALLRNLRLSE